MFFLLYNTCFSKEVVLNTSNNDKIVGITSFVMNSKNEMFLLSFKLRQIFKFNSKGAYIKTFCRKGQGPGEINRVFKIFINPQNNYLYLPEFFSGTGKVTIYDSNGTYMGLLKIKGTNINLDTIESLSFSNDSEMFIMTNKRVGWKSVGDLYITQEETNIKSFDKNGKFINNVFTIKIDGELSNKMGFGGPNILFKPHIIMRKIQSNHIMIAKSDESVINIYSKFGKITKSIKLNLSKNKLSKSEFIKHKKLLISHFTPESRMHYLAKHMIKRKYKSIYDNIFILDDKIILSQNFKIDNNGNVQKTKLQIYNLRGKKIGEQFLNGQVIAITNNLLLKINSDSDDNKIFSTKSFAIKNLN